MKKSILTIGLFSLMMILTSFTSPAEIGGGNGAKKTLIYEIGGGNGAKKTLIYEIGGGNGAKKTL